MFPEIENRRRGRSKRRLIIPVLVSMVAFAWWVSSISRDNLDAGSYIAQVRDVADNQAARAAAFETLYLGIRTQAVPRETLVVSMDQLSAALEQDIETLALIDAELPVEAQEVRVLINLALNNWRTGLLDFQSSALQIPAGGDASAELNFRASIGTLQVGDALYKSLVEEVQVLRAASNLSGSPFPDVTYMSIALGSGSALDQTVEALRSNDLMTSEQSVSIAFSNFQPELLGDTTSEGLSLLPSTEVMSVEVTLTNQGTDTEVGLRLAVTLTAANGIPVTHTVDEITLVESGATLFRDFEVEPNVTYTLTAVLKSEAGIIIQENSTEFQVSPPSN